MPTTRSPRQIGDRRLADDRREVMLAMRLERDVLQQHDLVIAADLLEGAAEMVGRILAIAAGIFAPGARDALRRVEQPLAVGIVAGPADQGPHRLLDVVAAPRPCAARATRSPSSGSASLPCFASFRGANRRGGPTGATSRGGAAGSGSGRRRVAARPGGRDSRPAIAVGCASLLARTRPRGLAAGIVAVIVVRRRASRSRSRGAERRAAADAARKDRLLIVPHRRHRSPRPLPATRHIGRRRMPPLTPAIRTCGLLIAA